MKMMLIEIQPDQDNIRRKEVAEMSYVGNEEYDFESLMAEKDNRSELIQKKFAPLKDRAFKDWAELLADLGGVRLDLFW